MWWVRIFDFPCAQLTTLGLLIITAWLYEYVNDHGTTVSTGMMPFLVVGLIIQGYRIYPYTILSRTESQSFHGEDSTSTIRILAFNVLMTNRQYHEVISLIEESDPDLILLTEPDHEWERALQQIEKTYQFTIKKPLENTYGMLLYSRYELFDSEVRFLVEEDVPSIYTSIRLPSGDTVDLYGLHPRPPDISQDVHERDAELLIVGRLVKQHKRPAIVAGDLNDVAWSHTTRLFQRLSGLFDPRIGRGFYNTFPTHLPFFRFPMDHIFHSEHMSVKHLQVLNAHGSDHYPIYASLYLHHNHPHAHCVTQDVHQESQEKIVSGLQKAKEDCPD